jgi:TPR repeat protein
MRSRFTFPFCSLYVRVVAGIILALGAWRSCHAQVSAEIEHLLKRAEAGYLAEQMKLAHAFQVGSGVALDASQAAYWMLKAANQGDPGAQTDLGFAYFNGIGVEADPNAAFRWFQRAALTNYPPAENDLAVLMIKGIGVQQDPVAGARWMRKAADSNLAALNAPRHLLPAWHWRRSR